MYVIAQIICNQVVDYNDCFHICSILHSQIILPLEATSPRQLNKRRYMN